MELPAAPLPGAPLVPPPQLFTLRDGRVLAYSYFGAPLQHEGGDASHPASGSAGGAGAAAAAAAPPRRLPPILYFHGFCSSRLEAGLLHADALHHGLSVVAVDRPGAGQSTLNPEQSVESMAEDARQLLDHLGLERVAVMGASGGSPFACACAALLPERVQALALVCPLMPTAGREEQLLPGHSPTTLRLFHAVREQPWRLWATLHALRFIQKVPHGNLLLRVSGFAEEDQRVTLELPAMAGQMKASVREGLRQGVAGAIRDLQIYYVDPPTIDLSSIRQPTVIWQGGQDATTPPAMARHYAAVIPRAQLHLLDTEAHLSLPYRHNRAILGSLVDALAGGAAGASVAGGEAAGAGAAGSAAGKANL
ncbi:2-hydroxy-6-oxo-6-phenylhexa-2,4-dienoate hydrolase [Chlorella sorokiniana]|uniref:2-hydroxy-6-oxo-6-phenylhexa-2,4-dienoate hydrolase n=1 Tax=Chlorella sorokiniana TaxID=3076 RepID=A0A2P6U0K7_CHLSO|nr:2-hydroxy-6-oxo-6-phenylhexa-2,4-dienoate hydrolase [Chlorella sorokiniana]|eukprot:PRW59847.1 2-hydroxy-6-oxo-6-phenylhexa-2,4-dienoate hydrolase [Chlorella sorokiniana]